MRHHLYLLLCILFFQVTNDLSAQTIRYVKSGASGSGTSWADASGNLSTMLNTAIPNTQVWVAKGTYKPTAYPAGCTGCTSLQDSAFLVKDRVELYGGFDGTETLLNQRNIIGNTTILSGDFNGDDVVSGSGSSLIITENDENAHHVVIIALDNTSNISKIDGFTIKGGNSNEPGGYITVNGQMISRYFGGGIYSTNGTTTFSNLKVVGNFARRNGGGMYNLKGINLLENNNFSQNCAKWDGGGIYLEEGVSSLTNNSMTGNYSNGDGGGIYLNYGSNTLTDNLISSNTTADDGGGIYAEEGDNTYSNNSFSGNTTIYFDGGGIYLDNGINNLENNTFLRDSADYGGGIYIEEGTNLVSNNTFSENYARNGGGIYSQEGTTTILSNNISKNEAEEGGGIYIDDGTNNISKNIVSENISEEGGGILIFAGNNTLRDNIISSNTADEYGGGVSTEGGINFWYNNYIFGNTAKNGGGMRTIFSNNNLINNILSGNFATESGGGIYAQSDTIALTNNTFSGNLATTDGGAIYLYEGITTITNSIFWGNSSEIFNDIASPSSLTVSYSIIQNGFMGCNNCPDMMGDGNSDPMFIAPLAPGLSTGGNYRLKSASPAINIGNNTADLDGGGSGIATIASVSTDLDGNARLFGSIIDFGAYEYNGLDCPSYIDGRIYVNAAKPSGGNG